MKNYYSKNKLSSFEETILGICRYEYGYFLSKANVIGVALGYKVKSGFSANRKCIKIFVTRKISKNYLCNKDLIPNFYKNIETDIVQREMCNLSSFTNKVRPVPGGYDVGPSINAASGTFGCLVSQGSIYYVLANNHNIASENTVPLDTPIVQPSNFFQPCVPENTIATLTKYIPVRPKESSVGPINLVDCAIGKITKRSQVSTKIALVGKISTLSSPKLGERVKKVGSATELTIGTITEIGATVEVVSRPTHYLYQNQIITTPMAEKGDSGSILLDQNVNALGLLLARSNSQTIYNNMDDVLKGLDVKLITK